MVARDFLALCAPCCFKHFRISLEICSEKAFHVRRIGRFESRYQDGAEERFDIEMTRRAKNANRLVVGRRSNLGDVTRGAVDSDRGKPAEMFHVCATETNRPSKVGIWNHSEMSEVRCRKQIRIRLNKCAQHRFRHDLRAHRAVQEKIHVLLRPCRHLRLCHGVLFDEIPRYSALSKSRALPEKPTAPAPSKPRGYVWVSFRGNLKKSDKICKARAIMCEIERVNRFVLYAGK